MKGRSGGRAAAIAAALTVVVMLLVYAPVVAETYGYSEDFTFLVESHTPYKWIQAGLDAGGRPIAGFVLERSFGALTSVGDLRYLRLLALLQILALAVLVAHELHRRGVDAIESALSASFLATLPTLQTFAAVTLFWSYLLPVFACWAAARLLDGIEEGAADRLRRSVLAAALLIVGLCIYQPATMFLWVWLAIGVLHGDADPLRRALRAAAVFFGAVALYFVLFRLLATANERAHATVDPLAKLWWFVSWVLALAGKLHWVDVVASWPGRLMVLGIAMAVALRLRARFADWPVRLLLLAAFVPLAFFSNLAVAENFPAYRTQVALMSYVALLFLAAVSFLATRLLPARTAPQLALAVLVVVSVVKARKTVWDGMVSPWSQEYAGMRTALAAATRAGSDVAYLVYAPRPPTPVLAGFSDEFDARNASLPVEWGVLRAMAATALWEVDPGGAHPIRLVEIPVGTPIPAEPGAAVITLGSFTPP